MARYVDMSQFDTKHAAPGIKVGARVKTVGFPASLALNDRVGVIEEWSPSDQRWAVRLDGEQVLTKFKVVNLALAPRPTTVSIGTSPEGLAWLEENSKKEGVVTLETGLQYRVLEPAEPCARRPLPDSPCVCHYRGSLISGAEFDNSYARGQPSLFRPVQVIRGWTQALLLMGEGAKWELAIPAELAYGDKQKGGLITPGSALIFELELVKVRGSPSSLAADDADVENGGDGAMLL